MSTLVLLALALSLLVGCGESHDDEVSTDPTPTPTEVPSSRCLPQNPDTSSCYTPLSIEANQYGPTCCDGSMAVVNRPPREVPVLCCPPGPSPTPAP